MNILLDTWATTMWRACWQGGLVVLVVWSICRLLPSMPARFQCWLWRLAVLKFVVVLLLPTLVNLPLLPAPSVASPMPEVAVQIVAQQVPVSPVEEVEFRSNRTIELPSVRAILAFLWIIGVGWSLARLLVARQGARTLRRQGLVIDNGPVIEQLVIQARQYSLRTAPTLLETEGNGSPMLIGILRPAIVVPAGTLQQLSPPELAMVLGHELAHIQRGDLLWNLAAAAVRAIFFFHPLVWLSQRRLNLAQEVAADELAILRQHHDPASYGKLLVSVIGKIGPSRLIPTMSMGTAGSVKSLTRRLIAMASIGRASRGIIVTSGILLAATVLLGIVPWRLVAAEPKVSENEKEPPKVYVATPECSSVETLPIGRNNQVPPNPYQSIPAGSEGDKEQQVSTIRVIPPATPATGPLVLRENQRLASIELWERKKGQAKVVLFRPQIVFFVGQEAKAQIGDKGSRVEVTVRSLPDEKPIQHVIEAKLIHDPEGKNPVTLMAPKLTLTDNKTGSVVVTGADGSELEMQAVIYRFRSGTALRIKDGTASSFRCAGDVIIEGKGFTAKANELQYDAEKELLTLSGGTADCTMSGKSNDGTSSTLTAQKIILSRSSSKVQSEGVRILAIDGHSPSSSPTEPTPPLMVPRR